MSDYNEAVFDRKNNNADGSKYYRVFVFKGKDIKTFNNDLDSVVKANNINDNNISDNENLFIIKIVEKGYEFINSYDEICSTISEEELNYK
jgi:hypothetical protein